MQHVVYRGGTPALNDVLAGTIPMTFGTVTQALPQWQAEARARARRLGARAPPLAARRADVPRAGHRYGGDRMVRPAAPAGTPKPIVAKLNAEMRRILALTSASGWPRSMSSLLA